MKKILNHFYPLTTDNGQLTFVGVCQLSAVSCLLLVTTLFSQVPSWYLERKISQYPSENYWIGVGSAKGSDAKAKEHAELSARRDLVSQFKVKISSSINSMKKESTVGTKSEISEQLEEKTSAVIDSMEIVGMKIAKSEIKDGQTYVLAVLEKESFIEYLAKGINEIVKRNELLRSSADSNAQLGNINVAIQLYLSVLNNIGVVFPKIAFYNIVAPKFYSLPQSILPEGIEIQLKSFLSNITLSIVSGNAQKGEIGKNLSEPFVVQALVKQKEQSLPLKGIDIQFNLGKNILSKAVTEENGKASYNFLVQSEGASGGKGKVIASVYVPNVSPDLRSLVTKNTTAEFSYSFSQTSIPCVVIVEGVGSAKAKESFQKKLSQSLEKNGMSISDDASIIVKAMLSSGNGSSIDGMNGTMYTQEVTLAIQIIDKATNKILGTASTSAKGLGKKEEEAMEKGISSIKIPNRELGEALSKAK